MPKHQLLTKWRKPNHKRLRQMVTTLPRKNCLSKIRSPKKTCHSRDRRTSPRLTTAMSKQLPPLPLCRERIRSPKRICRRPVQSGTCPFHHKATTTTTKTMMLLVLFRKRTCRQQTTNRVQIKPMKSSLFQASDDYSLVNRQIALLRRLSINLCGR